MKEKKDNSINLLLPIALVFGGALVWTLMRTAKAAVNLRYTVLGFGIYHFATGGKMVLRLRVRFTNAQNTPLTVNMYSLGAYLNPSYTYDSDGNLKVMSRGSLIATCASTDSFLIPADSFIDKDFFIDVQWTDVLLFFVNNVSDVLDLVNGGASVMDYVRSIIGTPILVDGIIKAENVSIDVQQVINITNEMAI